MNLIILGAVLALGGGILVKLELVLAHLRGDPEKVNLPETLAGLLICFGGFACLLIGFLKV